MKTQALGGLRKENNKKNRKTRAVIGVGLLPFRIMGPTEDKALLEPFDTTDVGATPERKQGLDVL